MLVTSIRITCNSFPYMFDESRMPRPTRFEKSMMPWNGNTQPSIGNTHFFSRPNRYVGSDRFWIGRTSARPCISLEEIRFVVVTVVPLAVSQG